MLWTIDRDVPGREIGCRAIIDADGFTVCNPSPMGEDAARLIAAAPMMLAALQVIAASTAEGGNLNRIARRAIADATEAPTW